jgi:hypothetical protein
MIIGKAISPFALRKKSSGGGNDADAQAFITATGISGTNATATNQLVIDLKAANIWTKMKAIYPFVGGTSAFTHKFNLKDPRDLNAAYRLAFFGGGTFSANGYQPNASNVFADTFLIPLTDLTLNSQHISFYSRTNSNGTEVEIGCNDGGVAPNTLLEIRTAGSTYSSVATGTYLSYVDANSLGLYIGNRTASNVTNLFKNNTKVATGTTASTINPSSSIAICALNSGTVRQYYSSKQCAFSSIGDGLTDAEALAFYNAVQTFNTTLGRQV